MEAQNRMAVNQASSSKDTLRVGPPVQLFRPVRRAFLNRLESVIGSVKLISIVAPTGYGKTVLMTGMYDFVVANNGICYWVDLNEMHNSVESVVVALKSLCIDSPISSSDTAFMHREGVIESQVSELADSLSRLPSGTTIFIDNLNACGDQKLGVLLDSLVFRTGQNVNFIWSSNTEPDYDRGRAKLEGFVHQVGLDDLGLMPQEVQHVFGEKLCGEIGIEGIERITELTEGWPAAIRMAQIALSESDTPSKTLAQFSGNDEDIAAFLTRQVMSRFSDEMQEFLCYLGLLRSFTKDLCEYAFGILDTEIFLDELQRRHVFIISLDRNRQEFRLHGLFRDYLQRLCEKRIPEGFRLASIGRASLWSENQGNWHDAIEYAFQAKDLKRVSQLLGQTANSLVREQGDIQQHVAWTRRLQRLGGELGLESHYWLVWALVFQGQYESGRIEHKILLTRFESLVDKGEVADDLEQRLNHLRMCIDLFTDRLDSAGELVAEWIDNGSNPDAYTLSSMRCINSIYLNNRFEFSQARQSILKASTVMLELGGPYSLSWVGLIHGLILYFEGEYVTGLIETQSALAQAIQAFGNDSPICGSLACVVASFAVESGKNEVAESLVPMILSTLPRNLLTDSSILGVDAIVKLWDDSDQIQEKFVTVREAVQGHPPRLSLLLSCFYIRRLLVLNKVDIAESEACSIGMNLDNPFASISWPDLKNSRYVEDAWFATLLDLLLAKRQLKSAEKLLKQELQKVKKEGRQGRLVFLELALAKISFHTGSIKSANYALISAVRRASSRSIVRPFYDSRSMISQIIERGRLSKEVFILPLEQEFFTRICFEKHQIPISSEPLKVVNNTNLDVIALTKREGELLEFLNTGLSNAEIAAYSGVSVTTIKWHLKNLYRKLDVSSRGAAIERARALNMLV